MADVKICDNCGQIFNPRIDGWASMTIAIKGSWGVQNQILENCQKCTKDMLIPKVPELTVNGLAVPSEEKEETVEQRIERLEEENERLRMEYENER